MLLRDGQRVTGLLIENSAVRVVLRVKGIDVAFVRERVDRVKVLPSLEERYRARRRAIDDTDTDSLLMLAAWLHAREMDEYALKEVEHVLAIDPLDERARQLHLLIRSQMLLRRNTGKGSKRPDKPVQKAEPKPGDPVEFPLLTPEQINLIKVYEVDLADPPRLLVSRQTIEDLMERYAGHDLIPTTQAGREAMYDKRPEQILDVMFRLQARDLYGQVRVLGQPSAMRRFRDDVHRTWLINSCSSVRCHGGPNAGRLMLYNRRSNSDASVYTNFLILERYRLRDGTPLINYDEPERSPLLQAGLRPEDSLYPHPVVRGYRSPFRSTKDRRYRQAVAWIQSMYTPRPKYPIDYTPPKPSEVKDAAPTPPR